MKFATRLALLAFVSMITLTAPARAAVLLEVGGTPDRPITFNLNEAIAVSFNLSTPFDDVSFSAPLICDSCTFTLFLMQARLGPSATVGDLVHAASFSGIPLGGTLFSGLDLAADDYFVVVANLGGPSIIWEGGASPAVSSAPGVTHLEDWASTSFDVTFPPTSVFEVILNQGARFYTVEAAVRGAVPEPGTAMLLLFAAGLVIAVRLRR
jgi:hypothetical protein